MTKHASADSSSGQLVGRILLVDDQPNNLKVLTATLAPYGYKLLTAMRGERAFEIAQESLPDLILLDINLPDISGFDVCKRLKANDSTKEIPVIFLSALDDVQSKVEGFRLGGIDYVTKPFYKEEVLARIETQLEIQLLRRSIEQRNEQLHEANMGINESITYAKRIQDALMPAMADFWEALPNAFMLFQPKAIVSGDFFWCTQADHRFFFVVADCTGHGVPGCFMSVLAMPALRNIIEKEAVVDPAQILTRLDSELHTMLNGSAHNNRTVLDGMDISLCCWDAQTRELAYASANRPVLLVREGVVQNLAFSKQSIGGRKFSEEGFQTFKETMAPGDRLFLFTDGFTDQFGGEQTRRYSIRRFRELIGETASVGLDQVRGMMELALAEHMRDEAQTDDILILGVEF